MEERRPRLEGKVAIVTGAGPSAPGARIGTGKAISMRLAREGARVLLVDRILSRAEETMASIREEGGEAAAFEADVSIAENCRRMVEAAWDRYGTLNVLVNNVGIINPGRGSVVDVEEEAWDRVIDVNLKSMMLTSKYAIPRMVEAGGGAIVNISSVGGLRGANYSQVDYHVSKGGVIALTMMMAAQHGREKIRVNCIAPGVISTPMLTTLSTDEELSQIVQSTPLGTEGTGWDIAWAAVYLVSDEARWVTGITLPVDGGMLTGGGRGNPPPEQK